MAGMGTYMMQGMQRGIEGMRNAVVRTAQSISGDIKDGLDTEATVGLDMPGSAQAAYYNNSGAELTTNRTSASAVIAVSNASQQPAANGNIVINFNGPVNMRDEQEVQDVGGQLARQLQAARAGAY